MKKVTQQTETISIDEITNSSIVGIDWGGWKTQVIKKDENCYVSLSTGSIYLALERPTKKEYTEIALKRGKRIEAYVFDTYKELYLWLSE